MDNGDKRKKMDETAKRRLLLLLFFVIGVFVFWSSLYLQDLFYNSLEAFRIYIEENEFLGIAVFFLLAALSAMLSPFSSIPLIPVAIVSWGAPLSLILLLGGWLFGESITYFIGKYAGRSLLKFFIPFEKIEHYKKLVPEKSQFLLVLLFRLAVPAEIPGYVLGAVGYDFWKYLLATFLAELPFAIITIYSGKAFVTGDRIVFISLILLLISLISLAAYLFRKKVKRR